MRKILLCSLLLCGLLCGCRAEPDWETVDDDAVLQVSAMVEPPYVITYGVPDDASMEPPKTAVSMSARTATMRFSVTPYPPRPWTTPSVRSRVLAKPI